MVIQWRAWGSYTGSWRNAPSFLDGFAMSRSIFALGKAFDLVSQHMLTPVLLDDPEGEWHTLNGQLLDFWLEGPTTVVFSYGLPVTQVRCHHARQ